MQPLHRCPQKERKKYMERSGRLTSAVQMRHSRQLMVQNSDLIVEQGHFEGTEAKWRRCWLTLNYLACFCQGSITPPPPPTHTHIRSLAVVKSVFFFGGWGVYCLQTGNSIMVHIDRHRRLHFFPQTERWNSPFSECNPDALRRDNTCWKKKTRINNFHVTRRRDAMCRFVKRPDGRELCSDVVL